MIVIAFRAQQTTGSLTFDVIDLQHYVASGLIWGGSQQLESVIFWAFAAAFLVKSPVFPFHTWAPDMYVESPRPDRSCRGRW